MEDEGENPVISGEATQQRATFLQDRVKVLEDHNSKLESYITQLKKVAEMVRKERGS